MLAASPQMRAIGGVLPQSANTPLIAVTTMLGMPFVQKWVTACPAPQTERLSFGDASALHSAVQGTE